MTDTDPTPDPAMFRTAAPEDPNTQPAAQPPTATPPEPEVEPHAETGTTLLHYYGADLDDIRVINYARAAGYDIVGLPDRVAPDHWRIQVAADTKETV